MAVKRGPVRKKPEPVAAPIELTWSLGELPTSQHRAGLAGLVLMVNWLSRQRRREGTCEITALGASGATLRVDALGMKRLFDATYAVATEERAQQSVRKDKSGKTLKPIRTEERVEADPKSGKPKTRTTYVYEDTVPDGAWLAEVDSTPTRAFRKLWRDVTWSFLRAIPATRRAYLDRAGDDGADDWSTWWSLLREQPDREVAQKSHFLLGAMDSTAEDVSFRDRARFQLLLNFWSHVAPMYEVRERDVKGKEESRGYAIAVPDVAELDAFCDVLVSALKTRPDEMRGYRPRAAVLSLPAESGLDFMRALQARLTAETGRSDIAALVAGVDVFHLTKPGQSTQLRSLRRLHPVASMIDEYASVHSTFRDAQFLHQRVTNALDGRPWHAGFVRVFETRPVNQTIGSNWFRNDCRNAFKLVGAQEETNMNPDGGPQVASLETLVHRFVGDYVKRRVDAKYGLRYDSVRHDASKLRAMNEKREKIAQEAFYAVRSRSGADFVTYFAGTLGSVPQFLRPEEFAVLARCLHERTEEVRALAMLALSAWSWSPNNDTRSE